MIIRRAALPRSTKPIPKRRPGPPRRGAGIDLGYVTFLHGPQIKCTVPTCPIRGACDGAHTARRGAAKGPDSTRAPLCRVHHQEYDGQRKLPNGEFGGKVNFERYYDVDMQREAASHYTLYLLAREAQPEPGERVIDVTFEECR